ncbi:MAG: lipopolysaccharide kinase InaA family protein [Desulfomonilia bacterium]
MKGRRFSTIHELLDVKYPDLHLKLLQERSSRSVYTLEKQGRAVYYVKVYSGKDFLSRARNRFFSRTLYEATMLENLKAHGIPVPEVHDHILHAGASVLITRAIDPARSLWQEPPSDRGEVMLGMASLLLRHGFSHRDLHPGNIILDFEGKPFLVDAYEISTLTHVSQRDIVGLFSQVFNSSDVSLTDLERHLDGIPQVDDSHGLAERILRRALRTKRTYVRKRVRRSLREGSFSTVRVADSYTAYIRRGAVIDVENLISEHERNVEQGINILKTQEKTQLSRVGQYCVKSYRAPRLFQEPYARRSWKGLLALLYNGIGTAEPFAVVIFRDGRSALITSAIPHQDLDRFLGESYETLDMREKLRIARALGSVLGYLHVRRIYHADMKACNIKIDPETLGIYFLDTDRVRQTRGLSDRRRYENLVQINTSIPRRVSRSVRMAFIHAYAERMKLNPRELFARVWNFSRSRDIVYCTAKGDQFETWSPEYEGKTRSLT